MGMTPEEIVATYPTLTLPAVYASLAYYHSHRAEIDADIEADERFVAEMKPHGLPPPATNTRALSSTLRNVTPWGRSSTGYS
jgi:hypothetical protein